MDVLSTPRIAHQKTLDFIIAIGGKPLAFSRTLSLFAAAQAVGIAWPCCLAHSKQAFCQSSLRIRSGLPVRSFLQARGKVNKGIRATILTEPSMFFACNNGVTAIAQGVGIENTDSVF